MSKKDRTVIAVIGSVNTERNDHSHMRSSSLR